MYQPPREDRPGCRETWVLTRAVFAVIIPAMLAMTFVLGAVVAAVILFAVHPALALAPIGVLALGVALYARWERSRFPPPGA